MPLGVANDRLNARQKQLEERLPIECGIDLPKVIGNATSLVDVRFRRACRYDREMGPGDRMGERALLSAGNIDQDNVGTLFDRGFLQMLSQFFRVWCGNADIARPRLLIGKPTRNGLIAVEIDDVDVPSGFRKSAGHTGSCGRLVDAALR